LVKPWLLLAALVAGVGLAQPAAAPVRFPEVTPGTPIRLPRDHGSHPDHRIEWWYVTGWLRDDAGKPLGFQVTFFRSRPAIATANPSAFTPRQVMFAHAALSDPALASCSMTSVSHGPALASRKPALPIRNSACSIGRWSAVRTEASAR
jgi:predicted secreted hydrolase